jgi:hypothetical protein
VWLRGWQSDGSLPCVWNARRGVRGDVLEGNEVQHEEVRELGGGLDVKFEVSDRKAKRVKERQYNFEGGDICRRRARLYGVIVDKATVKSDKDILVTKIRRDRKTTSEIGGGPFRVMGGGSSIDQRRGSQQGGKSDAERKVRLGQSRSRNQSQRFDIGRRSRQGRLADDGRAETMQGQRREETCEWRRSPDGECQDGQTKWRAREEGICGQGKQC